MYKHLKSKQEYIDFYDRLTVDHCRVFESSLIKSFREGLEKVKDKKDIDEYKRAASGFLSLGLFYKCGDEWERKKETIQGWMDRDEERDKKVENANPIKGVNCLNCNQEMSCDLIDLQTNIDDKPERMMFWYECKRCDKRRAFYDNGDEYTPKETLCPKCNIAKRKEHKREKKIITTKYICDKCGHTEIDTLDLSDKPKKEDPNYEQDRQRFVIDDKKGQEYLKAKQNAKNIQNFMKEMKEKEDNKESYDKVNNLNKLKISALKELLSKKLNKHNYTNLDFKAPEIDKNVIINFTVQDNLSNREDMASQYECKKLIKKTLINTNWRLMSEGISCRLGILNGRLRGYEREEDLLKLVNKK
jgi:hypothetical protein